MHAQWRCPREYAGPAAPALYMYIQESHTLADGLPYFYISHRHKALPSECVLMPGVMQNAIACKVTMF